MGAQRTAVIIGAGPAGLTAALELIRRTDVRPVVIEASNTVGGISRTVNFNGYRMDIAATVFFPEPTGDEVGTDPGRSSPARSNAGFRLSQLHLTSPLARDEPGADGDKVMLLRIRYRASTFCASSSTTRSSSTCRRSLSSGSCDSRGFARATHGRCFFRGAPRRASRIFS